MGAEGASTRSPDAVDEALQSWRQGDCVLGEQWFAYRIYPALPLTEAGLATAEAGADLAEDPVRGFAVVSQTCDLVRKCEARPFAEVSPLVEVDAAQLHAARRGRSPRYGYLPALAASFLVVDLDRVMTVEKSLLVSWDRQPGWTSDSEGRAFAVALARKRARFAFPDDFVEFAASLQKRLVEKHDKETDEGRALRALREIRVVAAPSWDAATVDVFFWFIRDEEDEVVAGKPWNVFLDGWLERVKARGRFLRVAGQVSTLQEMTAADYVDSDPLDLDHLSRGTS